MDIYVSKFREKLALVKATVPRKPTLPALKNVMLKDGKLVATNMDTLVAIPMPEADINCLIPYAEAVRVIDYIPGDDMLHITAENGQVNMAWSDGSAHFNPGGKGVDDFPPVPEFAVDAEARLDIDTLISDMEELAVYTSDDSSRTVLQGVALFLGPEKTQMAAGDGFRMAVRDLPLQFPKETVIIVPTEAIDVLKVLAQKAPRILPAAAATSITSLLTRRTATVAVDAENKGVRIDFDGAAIVFVRLIQGTPPNFAQLIPKDEPQLVTSVMGMDLDLAVRRVRDIAKEGNGIVRLVFNDGAAVISARGDGHQAESTVRVMTSKGSSGRVAINARYLIDYLKGREGIITITLYGQSSPVAFRYQKAPTVIIMPMQVVWGDEPVKAEAQAETQAEAVEPAGETKAEAEETTEEAEAEQEAETEPEEAEPANQTAQ